MRILISLSELLPGSGLTRYVYSLCKILCDDNEVSVLVTHNKDNTEWERNELAKVSTDIKFISLGSYSKPMKYLNAIKFIRKENPDIIINNFNAVVQFILPFLRRSCKVVHVLHNDYIDFYRIASINAKLVSGWIAPTKAMADHFNEYTFNKYSDKVVVIPHGVKKAKNSVLQTDSNNEELKLIFVGVVSHHKGVELLPAIIYELNNRGINFSFKIVGQGDLEVWLQEQLKNEIDCGQVTLTGCIDHQSVYELMKESDVFLYPTLIEAFGLVIAEAMMCGAVPVASLLEGITDNLVTDGNDGFLLNCGDISGFCNRVELLAKDRNLLDNMRLNAKEKAMMELSEERMSFDYLNYLNNQI